MSLSNHPLIVIADDEPAIRETVGYIFKKHGFEVLTACNGKEALEMVRKVKPDMAILDILMPEGEGPEICGQIRKDPLIKNTFVVILTSNLREVDQLTAIKQGADAFLTKPFHEKEIMLLARQAIQRSKSLNQRKGENDGTKN